jgi:DNA-binding HxlR family transcriptional regulator
MVRRKSFSGMQCPIARSIESLGDGWSLLILRTAFMGACRFQEFQSLLGIPPNTLSCRLDALIQHGLLTRETYCEHPPREAYRLTPKGVDVLPVLLALTAWGNRWLATEGVAIECVDAQTGRRLDPVVVDRRTGRPLLAGAVALQAGPGARPELRRALARPLVLGEPGSKNP